MDKVKIKWGIIGLGNIAHQFAKELLLVEEAQICAVASRNIEKAQQFANNYNCDKAYGSYDALFEDEEIDIIYIATPHDSHAALTIKALQNNKHVLCEKPIALKYDDALQMINASKKYNKFFMEAFWTRFNPSIQEILYKIKNGEIGEVKYVNADFAFQVKNLEGTRMTDIKLGGGSLFDIGVYPIFLSYLLLGIPKEIIARSNFHKYGADLQTSILLQYENAQAILHSSFVSASNMEATISGTEGRITISPLWFMSQSYSLVKDNHNFQFSKPTLGKGYTYEIMECHTCIKENRIESQLWSHQNSLELMKIVDEISTQIGLEFPS